MFINKLKMKWLILGIIVMVIVVLFALFFCKPSPVASNIMNTKNVFVHSVQVSSSTIDIKVDFLTSSTLLKDYETIFKNNSLFVEIISGKNGSRFPHTISIPNTYDNINTIYLQGSGESDRKIIWKATNNMN